MGKLLRVVGKVIGGTIAVAGGIFLGKTVYDKSKSNSKKKSEPIEPPFSYDEIITKEVFESLALKSSKEFRRINLVSVENQYVKCSVKAVSGISTWEFLLNFNDGGKVTGNYSFVYKENDDAEICNSYAQHLSNLIVDYINNYEETSVQDVSMYKCTKNLKWDGFEWNGDDTDVVYINNPSWNQILTQLKDILFYKDIVNQRCSESANSEDKYFSDDYIRLQIEGSNVCLEFGSYEGFSYRDEYGNYKVLDRFYFDHMSENEILEIFHQFYLYKKNPTNMYWN